MSFLRFAARRRLGLLIPRLVGLTLVGLIALSSGCPAGPEKSEFVATIAELDGEYEVRAHAEGSGGAARYLTVELNASKQLWQDRDLCPVWTGVRMTANDRELTRTQDGFLGYLSDWYCATGFYVLEVDPNDWQDEPYVTLTLEDSTGTNQVVFQNFVVAPRVTLLSPVDGVLHVGDPFVLRFEPSVHVHSSLSVGQGTEGTGINWVQLYTAEFPLDQQVLEFTVPAVAHVPSTEPLQFFTGSGWLGPVVDCSDASYCYANRVACPDGGCASPLGFRIDDLDDVFVTVPISVEP